MMKTFCSNFIKKLYIQGLIQGNVDKETALTVANTLVKDLACKPIKEVELPKVMKNLHKNLEIHYCNLCSILLSNICIDFISK